MMSALVCKFMTKKVWLLSHLLRPGATERSPDLTQRMFREATDIVDSWLTINTDPKMYKMAWFVASYGQWQLLAYMLSEIPSQPRGPDLDRAWAVADGIWPYTKKGNMQLDPTTFLYKPLHILMRRASAHRETLQRQDEARLLAQTNELGLSNVPNTTPYDQTLATDIGTDPSLMSWPDDVLMNEDIANFDPSTIDWKQWQPEPRGMMLGEWEMPDMTMPAFGEDDHWL